MSIELKYGVKALKGAHVLHAEDLTDYLSALADNGGIEDPAVLPNRPTRFVVVATSEEPKDGIRVPDEGMLLIACRTDVMWVYAEDFVLAPAGW